MLPIRQRSIIFDRFVPTKLSRKDILAINHLSTIQQRNSQPVCHRNKIVIRYLGPVQIDHTIVEIDIRPLQDTGFIDPKSTINHNDENISGSLSSFHMLRVCNYRGIKFFENLLLFLIGQITDRFVLDIPLTPFVFRNVVA